MGLKTVEFGQLEGPCFLCIIMIQMTFTVELGENALKHSIGWLFSLVVPPETLLQKSNVIVMQLLPSARAFNMQS